MKNHRNFFILVLFLVLMSAAASCDSNAISKKQSEEIARAAAGNKVVRIYPRVFYKSINNPNTVYKNWDQFFSAGVKKGLFAKKENGDNYIGILKDEYRSQYGYHYEKGAYAQEPFYEVVVGTINFDSIEYKEREGRLFWTGRLEPNEIGNLLVEAGLGKKLDLEDAASGNIQVKKDDDGKWLYKKLGDLLYTKLP